MRILLHRFSFKTVMITTLSLSTAAWIATTSAAWSFVKYRQKYTEVRYKDIVFPSRWAASRVAKGDFFIRQAERLLQEKDFNQALHLLRSGVAGSPKNLRGRLLLSEVYLAYGRPDLAVDLLSDDQNLSADNFDALTQSISLLIKLREDQLALTLAKKNLSATSPARLPGNTAWVAALGAKAALNLGNFDDAADIVKTFLPPESADAVALDAQIVWEKGYAELALVTLENHLASHSGNDALRALQINFYRLLNRTHEWETAVIGRMVADPFASAPRIDYLLLHHQRGDAPKVASEVEHYLQLFSSNEQALLLLADFAAYTGQSSLARRVQTQLNPQSEAGCAVALMVAESCVTAGSYQEALDLLTRYSRDFPQWTTQYAAVLCGLKTVAYHGLHQPEEARLNLELLVSQKNLRAENLVVVSNRLLELGAEDLALLLFSKAALADPHNEAALTNLLKLELKTQNFASLPQHIDQFLKLRNPSREIATSVRQSLGSDQHLFLNNQADLLVSLRSVTSHAKR
ncbi:tetratricopeptide repeat protein [Oleiharenicola lentus]|uniref:tetratricopeptide repeat protein n=1 Tax=Oleiharenicola lentus TaxID=2508720 RepID=UPI003F67DA8C